MMRILFTLLLACSSFFGFSQIANSNFENWTYGADSFGLATYIPFDTFSYLKIDDWTSSNSLTGNDSSGGKFLVNRSTDSYSGAYAVRMNTDSIYLSGGVQKGIIAPGFIVNGNFRFDLISILFQSSGSVAPQNLKGAGSAVSQRIQKVGAYVKYAPVNGDSLLIWAVLKKNGNMVAQCKLYSSQAYSSYHYIEGSFSYFSCEVPDTAVVLIASSNPNFSSLLSDASGLTPGSVLLVDSVSLVPFATGQSQPVANNLSTYVFTNHSKKITVLSSDTDCTGHPLTIAVVSPTPHGTAVVAGDTVIYTPAPGFAGVDTVIYTVSNGQYTSTAMIVINVLISSGVTETGPDGRIALYPNPVHDIFELFDPFTQDFSIEIVNALGQMVSNEGITQHGSSMNVSGLSPGTYLLKVTTPSGIQFLRFIKD